MGNNLIAIVESWGSYDARILHFYGKDSFLEYYHPMQKYKSFPPKDKKMVYRPFPVRAEWRRHCRDSHSKPRSSYCMYTHPSKLPNTNASAPDENN